MKKYMKIDENTITVTLDPDPTKSLLLPLIAKNSPKCLSFNTSQAGGCGNGTKWEVKYPNVGGLIGSEVVLNIAGDNVILEGVTLPSLSCAVNALRNPDADYAMNLEFTASCSAVLKFDRQSLR
uniref:Uncharacterized protein n=1 Tax=Ditylenchus dipsaci TaxID=166011 RepID=A0A915DUT7_9BILA